MNSDTGMMKKVRLLFTFKGQFIFLGLLCLIINVAPCMQCSFNGLGPDKEADGTNIQVQTHFAGCGNQC